jgi:hypothetical protein
MCQYLHSLARTHNSTLEEHASRVGPRNARKICARRSSCSEEPGPRTSIEVAYDSQAGAACGVQQARPLSRRPALGVDSALLVQLLARNVACSHSVRQLPELYLHDGPDLMVSQWRSGCLNVPSNITGTSKAKSRATSHCFRLSVQRNGTVHSGIASDLHPLQMCPRPRLHPQRVRHTKASASAFSLGSRHIHAV